MNVKSLNELELTEILKIAQDEEKKLKDMNDHATMMDENGELKLRYWRKMP